MNRIFFIIFIIFVTFPVSLKAAEKSIIHHELTIKLYPEEGRFVAEDLITVPGNSPDVLTFLLHAGLEPASTTPGIILTRESGPAGGFPIESFTVKLPHGLKKFEIKYGGKNYSSLHP